MHHQFCQPSSPITSLADMLGMLHSTELTFSAQKPENQRYLSQLLRYQSASCEDIWRSESELADCSKSAVKWCSVHRCWLGQSFQSWEKGEGWELQKMPRCHVRSRPSRLLRQLQRPLGSIHMDTSWWVSMWDDEAYLCKKSVTAMDTYGQHVPYMVGPRYRSLNKKTQCPACPGKATERVIRIIELTGKFTSRYRRRQESTMRHYETLWNTMKHWNRQIVEPRRLNTATRLKCDEKAVERVLKGDWNIR